MKRPPKALNHIVDRILAYKPPSKTASDKRRQDRDDKRLIDSGKRLLSDYKTFISINEP